VDLLAPVAQYEQSESQVLYPRARAYLAAGERTKAAAEFARLIGHRGWPDSEVFAPLAQLGLARAYAVQRDRENSRKDYDDSSPLGKTRTRIPRHSVKPKLNTRKLTATASVGRFSIRERAIGAVSMSVGVSGSSLSKW